MQILKGYGDFEILTPEEFLKSQNLIIERAGRTCYQSQRGGITKESAERFIAMLIDRGHLSVLEHSILSVKFINCSRGFTHELVRHRLASFSQESTRYVDESNTSFVVPPHRDEKEQIPLDNGQSLSLEQMLSESERYYRALRKHGWPPEDARQILPIAIKAEIVITANFREWRHIFESRTQRAAHWEIREVMCKLLETIKTLVPAVFDDFVLAGKDNNGIPYYKME